MKVNPYLEIHQGLKAELPEVFEHTEFRSFKKLPIENRDFNICESIKGRFTAFNHQIVETVTWAQPEIEKAVSIFLNWMRERTIVRVIGAGRARLAASIPANRLAHGGAQVYVQDDIIPMPHTFKGGGIIAASASGKTEAVLQILRNARAETREVTIIGIASADAIEFKSYCDVFIGIRPETKETVNPLRALADSEEYIISELLDAMVVAAGRLGGFADTLWRIGHENLGPTGPYDTKS